MVKRLRHRPFTAVTRVRFPVGSPVSLVIMWLRDFCIFGRIKFKKISYTPVAFYGIVSMLILGKL